MRSGLRAYLRTSKRPIECNLLARVRHYRGQPWTATSLCHDHPQACPLPIADGPSESQSKETVSDATLFCYIGGSARCTELPIGTVWIHTNVRMERQIK